MSVGLLVILIITAYFALAAAAAPKLMRLVYQDKLAVMALHEARHEEKMAEWRARKDRSAYNVPLLHSYDTELSCRREAQLEGFWWSLVWPASLAFHSLGATAFKQEIAAQHAKANAKVIADYQKLLHQRFADELADATSANPTPYARFRRVLAKEKH